MTYFIPRSRPEGTKFTPGRSGSRPCIYCGGEAKLTKEGLWQCYNCKKFWQLHPAAYTILRNL